MKERNKLLWSLSQFVNTNTKSAVLAFIFCRMNSVGDNISIELPVCSMSAASNLSNDDFLQKGEY